MRTKYGALRRLAVFGAGLSWVARRWRRSRIALFGPAGVMAIAWLWHVGIGQGGVRRRGTG